MTFGWFVSAEEAGHSESALVNPSKSALDQYGLLKDTQYDTPVTISIKNTFVNKKLSLNLSGSYLLITLVLISAASCLLT